MQGRSHSPAIEGESTYATLGARVFRGASWLALFKLASQLFSWVVTIAVAKILVPSDYGLMDMATIITGYAGMFNELGLGAAIIQRPRTSRTELSSVFWVSMGFSALLASLCFLVAYPTAAIFNEPRVIPITQATSMLFLFGGVQIVPLALMKKELAFKKIGFIDMTGIVVSCSCMYVLALMGSGTWTLIGGHLVREFTKAVLTYSSAKWFPCWHFRFNDAKPYLSFGIQVSIGESLFYLYDKSDKFFAGRAFNSNSLGLYSFALQLAKMPTEKIVVLINQVSFPVFAKLQKNKELFERYYLDILKITSTIVFPLFTGAYLLGEQLIRVLLNEKWYAMIVLFKFLSLAQIVTALNAINNFVHTAQGRPQWSMRFNLMMTMLMPLSFYFAVQYGLNAILVPWLTSYVLLCCTWIVITLRKVDIRVGMYVRTIVRPAVGSVMMAAGILVLESSLLGSGLENLMPIGKLVLEMLIACALYLLYLCIFDMDTILRLKAIIRTNKEVAEEIQA